MGRKHKKWLIRAFGCNFYGRKHKNASICAFEDNFAGRKHRNGSIRAFEKEYISEIESDTDRSRAGAETDSRDPG